jgi:hypothetical protein
MLWLFWTSNKRAPIKILSYFFFILKKEKKSFIPLELMKMVLLVEAMNSQNYFCNITLETTGGYASFLNGKVERPNCTIADMVRALYFNAGHSTDKWCYAAETAADIYYLTLHSALGISPYEAWYGTKPIIDPSTNEVKHANAVHFDEHNVHIPSSDQPSPGSLLLQNDSITTLTNPTIEINLTDTSHLQSDIYSLTITLPPLGQFLGCSISTCNYHNLPYISSIRRGSLLAQLFSAYGKHNSTYWILSLNNKEFSHAPSVTNYLNSLKQQNSRTPLLGHFAKRLSSTTCTTMEENRAMFNQIRLLTMSYITPTNNNPTLPLTVPTAKSVIVILHNLVLLIILVN